MKYKITFFDFWHISSGFSAGAKYDNIVIKDENGLPFITGKTIKGLIREQFEKFDKDLAKELFGEEGIKEGRLYFSNATIKEKEEIVANNLQKYLYKTIASTALENGIAKTNSLREIEVVIPLSLEGEIIGNINENEKKILLKAMHSLKRMGLNRNRGLGRCKIEEIK